MWKRSQAKSRGIGRKNLIEDEKLIPFVHFLAIFTQMRVSVSTSQAIVGAAVGVGVVEDAKTRSNTILVKIGSGEKTIPLVSGQLS